MKELINYKKRFYNLMESTMGDVKPLITEEESNPNCNPSEFFKTKPDSFNSFGKDVYYCHRMQGGGGCPKVKETSPKTNDYVNAYVKGDAKTVWPGLSSMIIRSEDNYFLQDEEQNKIVNGILKHYGANWRISDTGSEIV